MAYTTNIPAATDIPAQSQPLLQENCNTIATVFAVDHAAFNDDAEGDHVKISFTGAGTAPTTDFGLYATAAAMFLRNDGTNINISYNSFTAPDYTGDTVTITYGYFYLPCRLLVKLGTNYTTAAGHIADNINLDAAALGSAYTAVPFCLVCGAQTPMTSSGGGTNIFTSIRYLTSSALNIDTRSSAGTAVAGSVQWITVGQY
jgi:hypothetical protein